MDQEVLKHFLQFGQYTYPGLYSQKIKDNLPNEVREIGKLVRKQLIHRMTLQNGNTGSNTDLRYGDMTKIPWYRQPEDDIFVTSAAMLAELYRRDPNGFSENRRAEDKLILTCRFTAILTATLLKIKGIPARVRSGFAPYFEVEGLPGNKSNDHWINQYWSKKDNKWIIIDVDGSLEKLKFDPYNIPNGTFDFSADAWLKVRKGKLDGNHFHNAGGHSGLIVIAWELFYDFHCLMNSEVIYMHTPKLVHLGTFENHSEDTLKEIDHLATLIQKPDENFKELLKIWNTKPEFRLVKGALI